MENNKLYKNIVYTTLLLVLVLGILVSCIGKDILYGVSTLYGGALGIGGFLWIVKMTSQIEPNGNVQGKVIVHYLLRYLIYAGCLVLGIYINLNIFPMLIGFVCINLSIKYNAYKNGKEED